MEKENEYMHKMLEFVKTMEQLGLLGEEADLGKEEIVEEILDRIAEVFGIECFIQDDAHA